MLIHKFVVPITLTLLVSLVMVKCKDSDIFFKNENRDPVRDVPSGRSIQIELFLYNRCSKGNILLKGKKVTAAPGASSSKLVLASVGMGSKLTIHSNGTFLCFNKGGRLVNKRRRSRRKSLCEFREILRDSYSTFQSVFNSNWYIGFNRLGQPIRGSRKVRDRKWSSYMFLKRECTKQPSNPFGSVPADEWLKHINITDAS